MDQTESGRTFSAKQALAAVPGAVIVSQLDPMELGRAAADILRPRALARELPIAFSELVKVGLGVSEVEPRQKDRRFDDPTWRTNPYYRRLAQAYHVFEHTGVRLVDRAGELGWERQERARFLANIVTGAFAPTNTLAGNPAALKRALETGGASISRGVRNLVRDVATNGGMPRIVDTSPFRVGENVACTPGAVVFRDEMFEILQYTPTTPTVRQRPLVIVPPQLNRYYILDLAPGRSLVEYAVAHGVTTFMVVWRNPTKEHGDWALDDYLAAMRRLIDVVRAISGTDDVNWFGLCAGGATSALLLGHLASQGEQPIHSATFVVTMLDSRHPNMVGTLSTRRIRRIVDRDASRRRLYGNKAVGRNFAWMRPQDLVFDYVVRGWLLGENPPAYDILAWNDDTTRITAAFERDSLEVLATDKITRPGEVTVLGSPLDLGQVNVDTFHIAGLKDHITTWRPCYLTSQVLGGQSEMVIADTGHIQTFVNPPDSKRYHYWTAPATEKDPDAWMNNASKHEGSWWPQWAQWLLARSGEEKAAPRELGSSQYPPLETAPGQYVHEK